MTTFTDTNFTYSVLSAANKTLSIVGLNPTKYSATNLNWGTFPTIPLVYGGSNVTYNGGGNSANAYKITEIGTSAFESKTSFSNTTLTAAFLTSNLTHIGNKAFMAVKLVGTLTIPENIVNIGAMAFYNCTLVTSIVIGKVTNSDVVSHLSDLAAVLNKEIVNRKNADDSLNLLKAPINDATLTGTAIIPVAIMDTAIIATANVTEGVISSAVMQKPNVANRLDVSGNLTFSGGSVTTNGQWDFTVQPKYNGSVIATESFVNTEVANLAGETLSATLNTLSELTAAIENDPSLASTVINGNPLLMSSISSEISLRNSAVTSLSTGLSASASALIAKDAELSAALSTEISARSGAATSLSSALSASASSLAIVDSGISTALGTEISTMIGAVTSLSTALSASTAALVVMDSGLSTALSTEVSARSSAEASLSSTMSTARSSLSLTDSAISTGISAEVTQRSQSVSLVSIAVSAAASALTAGDAALSSALSVEASTRGSAVTSLSVSASGAMSQHQTNNLAMSAAFVAESTALSSSVFSLSGSTSLAGSAMISVNASLVGAISAEISTRISQTDSLSAGSGVAVGSLVAANTALSSVHSTEVSVRVSQVGSVSAVLNVALTSISTVAAGLSTSVASETSTATSDLSAAMSGLKGNADSSLDTLAEIASVLNTNPSLTQIATVMADITATQNALSTEVVHRASAIASVSSALSSSVVSLSTADASVSTALTAEVGTFNASIVSVQTSLANATTATNDKNGTLSTALSSEVGARAASLTAIGNALATASTSLAAADTSLSTAISAESANLAVSLMSFSTSLIAVNSSLASIHTLMSTSISAENGARDAAITSVSSVLAASAAAMQTAINATSTSIAAVSSEAALKTTTAYLSDQISTLVGGAPSTLDTFAEIGAALNNENNFAGSVATMLGNKAAVTDVTALSTTLALKANQTDYSLLSSVVDTKAASAAAENASISINVLSNSLVALISDVSTLKVNGTAINPGAVAVNSISLTDLQNWTKELYNKLALTNADGTINEKLVALTNPSLVSSTLEFEYDANREVTKVTHLITVQFDKAQTSATVTGGVGNLTTTVSNMVLNASSRYVFSVPYIGNTAYYTANKTQVNIVALEAQYRMAPLVSTVFVSAPDATDAAYKHAIPTVTNKTISTSVPNIFSVANPPGRYHAETFPDIGAMSSWDMSIYFHIPSGGAASYRGVVGSSYININGSGRNWGLWISDTNFIVWGWQAGNINIDTTLAVELNVNYNIKITKTTSTMQFVLKNMNTGVTQTQTSNHSNPSMGIKEPVTIGGWISSSGESGVVVSELHVGSYTNTSNYNTPSTSGINVYSSSDAYIKTVTTPGSGVFADSVAYEPNKLGSTVMKVSAAGDSSKGESTLINVSGEDVATHETPVLNGSVVYSGTIANATYTLASTVAKVSVFTKTNDIGPIVTGIATQYTRVGYGVESYGNWYGAWAYNTPGVQNAHYRLRFSNGIVSNVSVFSNSDGIGGLTNPDISFALTNIPAGGVTAILQGRNNAFAGNVWYDIVNKTIQVTPSTPIIKFGGGGNNQFVTSPAMFPTDTVVVSSATVTTPGTITLAIPYTAADVGTRSFYVVADADTNRKQSAASALQPFQ